MLIVGSGGREHALAWRLSQSPLLDELHAAPGNPGIAALGTCHPVRAEDGEGLLELARALESDLAVIGPEGPLVAGVVDDLRHAGVATFGPSAAAARIEGSKSPVACRPPVAAKAGWASRSRSGRLDTTSALTVSRLSTRGASTATASSAPFPQTPQEEEV